MTIPSPEGKQHQLRDNRGGKKGRSRKDHITNSSPLSNTAPAPGDDDDHDHDVDSGGGCVLERKEAAIIDDSKTAAVSKHQMKKARKEVSIKCTTHSFTLLLTLVSIC